MTEHMTIKEIAAAAGCGRETVRVAIKRVLPNMTMRQGVKVKLAPEAANAVMEILPKRNMVSGIPKIEEVVTKNEEAESNAASIMTRMMEFQERMQTQQQAFMERVLDRLQPPAIPAPVPVNPFQTPTQAPTPCQLPFVPEKTDRDRVGEIVRLYAYRLRRNHSSVWSQLYREFRIRYKVDVVARSKNQGITCIEYVEAEYLMPELLALATDIFR